MLPTHLDTLIQTTRTQYIETLFIHYYWSFETPAIALRTLITTLHDRGKMTQGDLTKQWTDAFSINAYPVLPSLEMEPLMGWNEFVSGWEYVYRFISILKPFQLYDLIKNEIKN